MLNIKFLEMILHFSQNSFYFCDWITDSKLELVDKSFSKKNFIKIFVCVASTPLNIFLNHPTTTMPMIKTS